MSKSKYMWVVLANLCVIIPNVSLAITMFVDSEAGTKIPPDKWHHYVPGIGCAPEVAEGNLKEVEQKLFELTQDKEFADAERFQAEIVKIQKLEPKEKLSAYFNLVGVDENDPEAVVNFIGARSFDPYLGTIEDKLGLNREQSTKIAETLSTALKGNLK